MTQLESIWPPPPFLGAANDLRRWRLTVIGFGETVVLRPDSIIGQPSVSSRSRLETSPQPMRTWSGRFVLDVSGGDDLEGIRARLERNSATFVGVLELLPPEDSEEDPATIAKGTLDTITIKDGQAALAFAASYPNGHKPICRDASLFPGFQDLSQGTWLPQVFGRCDLLAPPLFPIRRAKLAAPLTADDTELQTIQPVDWPPSGRLQVNDEVLRYGAISSDGLTVSALIRPNPLRHDNGTPLWLLPDAPLMWCPADHSAEVLEIRANDESGNELPGFSQASRELDGNDATVLERDALPLLITSAKEALIRETDLDSADWTVLDENTALNFADAFEAVDPATGATLFADAPLLAATYHANPANGAYRFDQVASGVLALEFSETPGWGPGTRLRVSVTKGATTVTADFDRRGFSVPVPFRSTAGVSNETSGIEFTRKERIAFDDITSNDAVSSVTNAASGAFHQWATFNTNSLATLSASFARSHDQPEAELARITLHAAVHNLASGASLDGQLHIVVPGKLKRVLEFNIAAETEETITLEVTPPSNMSAAEFFDENSYYTINMPDGGNGRIYEVWLEADWLTIIPSKAIGNAVERLPVNGVVDTYLTYQEIGLDIGALLPSGAGWDFFSDEDERPTVSITLRNAPDINLWAVYVRNIRWKFTTYPAESVRPTAQIWTRVEGRFTDEDGTASPASVIQSLVADELFGEAETSDVDNASFETASETIEERQIKFAAAFLEGTHLATVLSRAVAEATALLTMRSGQWTLLAPPLELDSKPIPALSQGDLLWPYGTRHLSPSDNNASGAIVLRSYEGTALTTASAAAKHIQLRWIVDGANALYRALEFRRRPREVHIMQDLAIKWMTIPAGAGMSIPGTNESQVLQRGEAGEIALVNGELHLELAHVIETQSAFSSSVAEVIRSYRRNALLFQIDGRIVAELRDSGDLYLRGELREGNVLLPTPGSLFVWDEFNEWLIVSCSTRAVAFHRNGDLLTFDPLSEEVPIDIEAPELAGTYGDEITIIGGLTPGDAALKIEGDAISLRGTLHTQQLL